MAKTPCTKWYGFEPDINHFKEFGCLCCGHIPKQVHRKLDSKAKGCIIVGYFSTSKACRLWSFRKRKVIISRDVNFDEEIPPCLQASLPTAPSVPDYSYLFPLENFDSISSVSKDTSSSVSSSRESVSVGVTLASTAPIGVSPALSLPISSPVVGANTTLNMIFSV